MAQEDLDQLDERLSNIGDAKQQVESDTATSDGIDQNISETGDKLAATNTDLDQTKADLKATNQQINSTDAELNKLNQKNYKPPDSDPDLKGPYDQEAAWAAEKKKYKKNSPEWKEADAQEKAARQAKAAALAARKDALKKQKQELAKKKAELQAAKAAAEKQLKRLQATKDELTKNKQIYDKRKKKKLEELEKARKRVEDQKKRLADLDAKNDELDKTTDKKKKKKLEGEIKKLKDQIKADDKRIAGFDKGLFPDKPVCSGAHCGAAGAGSKDYQPVTADQLAWVSRRYGTSPERLAEVLPYLNEAMNEYGINTPARKAQFLGQIAHESNGFQSLSEDPAVKNDPDFDEDAYFESKYGYQQNLGNTQPGDGARYRGRGAIQTTGRDNYTQLAKAWDDPDILDNPDKLGEDEYAFRSAGQFWKSHGLNQKADAANGDADGVSEVINQYDEPTFAKRQQNVDDAAKALQPPPKAAPKAPAPAAP